MLGFVTHIAKCIYGLQPVSIKSLQQQSFYWRGIYHISMDNGQSWVLRLMQRPEAFTGMTQTAALLNWLTSQHYPVPQVHPTLSGQNVGELDGWSLLLLSFIEGSLSEPHERHLHLLAQRLGHLHALPIQGSAPLLPARTHPENISSTTLLQLRQYQDRVPPKFQRLAETLADDMERISQFDPDLSITHGDCWYQNAVITPDGSLRLIDWDCAGMGFALLDFGYLLLTSHYDLTQPLKLRADEDKIRCIVEGYRDFCPISSTDCDLLLSAVRFALAFHLGSYMEQNDHLPEDDFILRKFQARFEVTNPIVEIAGKFLA